MPSSTRPPDSRSMVAISLASNAGCWNGFCATRERTRRRVVLAAASAIATIGPSSQPLVTWCELDTVSNPRSSSRRSSATQVAPSSRRRGMGANSRRPSIGTGRNLSSHPEHVAGLLLRALVPVRTNSQPDTPLGSTRGAKSVNHLDKDPPALGEIMAARACPFADGGALEATDRRAGRPNNAASARSCCSPASGPRRGGGRQLHEFGCADCDVHGLSTRHAK